MPAARQQPDPALRSDRSRHAVLTAAWELYETQGLKRLTVEGIAARSGVAKTTIYRWWPNKVAVLMDAVREHLGPQVPFPDTGSALDDLRQQLSTVVELLTGTSAGKAFLNLVAASNEDPAVADALVERYITAKRAEAIEVLQRGVDRGEFRADLDTHKIVDALYGAIYYRLLVSHDPPTVDYARELIDELRTALLT